ncbi:phage head closure protein [Devosia sp.]|uniref:phage head closure protein n=1 Tax=Devosia sp. TaxID=1871048 RepID=UPI001B1AC91D|nr:phage head closure protein [Devosia sp.]MBO9589069.1 phage head closure protein [Devosia sp.]
MNLRPRNNRDRVTAGVRDRVIRLERYGVTKDEFNQPTTTWSLLADRWASKEDVSDGEKVRASQVGSSLTTRFRVDYDEQTASLTTADRLLHEGKTYDISGVKEIGTREGIEITASLPGPVLAAEPAP